MIVMICSLSARDGVRGTINFNKNDLILQNVVCGKNRFGQECYSLQDRTYKGNPEPLITDLLFSFSSDSSKCSYDDTRRYRVKYSSYDSSKEQGSMGGESALFYKQEHRVEIAPQANGWLSSSGDLGSFTIEMKIKPLSSNTNAVLFSRIGHASGEKQGIEILIINGRIVSRFFDVFHDESDKFRFVELNENSRMNDNSWHHYALSYNRINGKLSSFVDGNEDQAFYITRNGQSGEGIIAASFSVRDMPNIIIGKEYHGYLDELRITYRDYESLRDISDTAEKRFRNLSVAGRIPVNHEGIISSKVISFKSYGTMVTDFSWKEDGNRETFSAFEFRISDSLFDENDESLQWYRIENGKKLIHSIQSENNNFRGKYFQWRARLIPSPIGSESPSISGINLSYELDPPPAIPLFVKAENAGDRAIILSWKKNVDFDLCGYKIYYGTVPGKYDGILRRVNGTIISNSLSKTDMMKIRIDSNLIEENRKIDSGAVLRYPVIKNKILYYFAVSAYDTYKIDTQYNHESETSNEVSARPYERNNMYQ